MQKLKSVLQSIERSGQLEVGQFQDLTQDEREIVNILFNENLVSEALVFLKGMDTEVEWQQFMARVTASKKQKSPLWRPLLKYAAIFVGVIGVGYVMLRQNDIPDQNPISEISIKLKMDNDNVKVIQEGSSQQIVSTSGKVLGVQKGNRISYKVDSEMGELVYNELEIPFGKVFEVELSDGTLVHLNSGTKIRYPVKFLNTGKREVFIEGEAYFRVAKDRDRPFIVHADEVAVEVLGTMFNMSSYNEDPEINTVLVEGSVRMSNDMTPNDHVVLKPGTKGSWHKSDHNIYVEEVDIESHTSWINGELVFRNSSFFNMIKKLERKYNVRIQNNNLHLNDIKLNARFSPEIENIDDVLKSISEIHPFNYKIIDREIEIN
ncbi:MAG: DUF4974 domain-containing protein [Flavobacteriaceae bacterium]